MQSSGMLLDTMACFQHPPWLMEFVTSGFAIQESSKRKQNPIKMESALQNTNSRPFRLNESWITGQSLWQISQVSHPKL